MKKIALILLLPVVVSSCQEEKKEPRDLTPVIESTGKLFRSIKDSWNKGYNDTIKLDTLSQ